MIAVSAPVRRGRHGSGVPQRVRGDVLLLDSDGQVLGRGGVPGDEAVRRRRGGEPAAGLVGNSGLVAGGAASASQVRSDRDGLAGERGCSVFAAFAVAADVRPAPEVEVVAGRGR